MRSWTGPGGPATKKKISTIGLKKTCCQVHLCFSHFPQIAPTVCKVMGTSHIWSLLPLLLVSFAASLVAALHFTLTSQQMSCRPILMSSHLLQHVFTCLFFTSIQYKLIIIYFLQAHWLTTNCVDSTIFLSQAVVYLQT